MVADGNAGDNRADEGDGDDGAGSPDGDEPAVQASVLRCHCQLSAASWSWSPPPSTARAFGQVSTRALPGCSLSHRGLRVTGRVSTHQEPSGAPAVSPDEGFSLPGLQPRKGFSCAACEARSSQKPQSGLSSLPVTLVTLPSLLKLKLKLGQKPYYATFECHNEKENDPFEFISTFGLRCFSMGL